MNQDFNGKEMLISANKPHVTVAALSQHDDFRQIEMGTEQSTKWTRFLVLPCTGPTTRKFRSSLKLKVGDFIPEIQFAVLTGKTCENDSPISGDNPDSPDKSNDPDDLPRLDWYFYLQAHVFAVPWFPLLDMKDEDNAAFLQHTFDTYSSIDPMAKFCLSPSGNYFLSINSKSKSKSNSKSELNSRSATKILFLNTDMQDTTNPTYRDKWKDFLDSQIVIGHQPIPGAKYPKDRTESGMYLYADASGTVQIQLAQGKDQSHFAIAHKRNIASISESTKSYRFAMISIDTNTREKHVYYHTYNENSDCWKKDLGTGPLATAV
ncbi:unnamed protein product [Albugo candida]|uniref:Uncharacterized protein n=1 Tax=Albugo candida TaxID=65357 RepID=A0A024GG20_9STRA|nr:unnamed protein product [Albugo candida]|eukprot:CCI45821.1 unnamed protein product [Albugo candida]